MKSTERMSYPQRRLLAVPVVILSSIALTACNKESAPKSTPTEITYTENEYKEDPLSKLIGDTWNKGIEEAKNKRVAKENTPED